MKTAIIFGSSGLIGNELFKTILLNNSYNKIKIFVRSIPEVNNPKVEIIKTDFSNLERFRDKMTGDDCFFCIGTTKQNSPNRNEYQKVELDIPKEIGQIAKANSVKSFIFISSIYANPNSSGNYVKFKGLVEEELKRLNFSKLGILRPSFLMGKRKENRVGEKIGILTFSVLSPLLFGPFKKMRPISSEIVAKAMIKIAKQNLQKITFESDEILKL